MKSLKVQIPNAPFVYEVLITAEIIDFYGKISILTIFLEIYHCERLQLDKNDNNLNMSLTFVGPWNRRLPNIAVISPSGTKYGSRNDDGNLIAQKWSSNVST